MTDALLPLRLEGVDLERAFPLLIMVDQGGVILRLGPSMLKVVPSSMVGRPLTEVFKIVRPRRLAAAFDGTELVGKTVGLETLGTVPIRFRGMVVAQPEQRWLFLISLVATSSEELLAVGLGLTDLPPFDSTADVFIAQQSKEMSLADARKLSEMAEAMRDKTEKIARLLDNVREGIFSFGPDRRVSSEFSQACQAMLGYSPAGMLIEDVLAPTDRALHELIHCCVTEFFAARGPRMAGKFLSLVPSELRINERVVQARYVPFVGGVMVTLSDLTPYKALEAKIAHQQAQLALVGAAVSAPADFFWLLEDFEVFLQRGSAPWLESAAGGLLAALHSFKGNFAQLGFLVLPATLQGAEEGLRRSAGRSIEAVFEIPWRERLEQDLTLLRTTLGDGFLRRRGIVHLSPDEVPWVEMLAREYSARCPDWAPRLANLCTLGYVSLRKELLGHDRYVQRLAQDLGKSVRPLVCLGDDVQVDPRAWRSVLLSLVHVFRNMVDHGIEDPDARCLAGKPPTGCIECRIERAAGWVRILIQDDGAGIQEDRLRQRARELGLDEGSMDLTALVAAQGLSTRSELSAISGLGVGMRAVKVAVESLGGTLRVSCRPACGLCVALDIPHAEERGRG